MNAKRGTRNAEQSLAILFRVPTSAPLTVGRLHYDGGGDWYANPSALPNLLTALRQRTTLRVADRERVVTLTGDELWDVPYLYMTGHGNVHFSDEELRNLRRYLEQGGFLHADDNYGMNESFRGELDAMTETARRLRRLGAPHARARALAAVLAGAGAALGVAAAGVRLAPRATGVVLAWLAILGLGAGAVWLAARAARAVADSVVGRLVERHAGARAGSVVGLLAPQAGGSSDL